MERKLTFGSLFAGIGGMDLGLERSGLNPQFVEAMMGLPIGWTDLED